ncbi:sulfur carrier protein ThiS [Cytobacillus firmus]|uniref:Sulfur carrier protein ThiS n=1 Tax=Cytobacillus firmus TaxID=1399 RepID=A0A380XAQ6_CYTFI|nr:sulfur carrier protein ThiS [Cytobacillus firmus]KAF0822276.1 Sulfur carrier protein ThiS [Cytobacillus firmus]MBG9543763.1 thiamine biosynthesis protein ThiS [Cytobacillus firmus]MBG9553100.1 thiamine biosynthesis protein ThiS [Cytobacillus firmus]MBG9555897.1 thiamine biosynthesis protein ThiS [Cytobacillus firmus]MBG9574891.1 thiamine biosynthesis protein ThiS [Cytobacillus firmus]
MNVFINGDAMVLPETINSVSLLLEHFHLEQKVVIVELNQHILDKSMHAETILTDGDRIEIVHFVGGG